MQRVFLRSWRTIHNNFWQLLHCTSLSVIILTWQSNFANGLKRNKISHKYMVALLMALLIITILSTHLYWIDKEIFIQIYLFEWLPVKNKLVFRQRLWKMWCYYARYFIQDNHKSINMTPLINFTFVHVYKQIRQSIVARTKRKDVPNICFTHSSYYKISSFF